LSEAVFRVNPTGDTGTLQAQVDGNSTDITNLINNSSSNAIASLVTCVDALIAEVNALR
jgi:hypothetical protein